MARVGRYAQAAIYIILNGEDSTPEQKLWAGVLLRAILDLLHKPTPSCVRNKEHRWGGCPQCRGKTSAKWWFLSSNGDSINSFPVVCEIIGVDPHKIREELKEHFK